jgi:hypothetical protein
MSEAISGNQPEADPGFHFVHPGYALEERRHQKMARFFCAILFLTGNNSTTFPPAPCAIA